ncbi:MAG: hypothetical protein H0X40_18885 [Chthoniobacterales bacterium]|nr:hypothetical protein [Chthoniobacterales bacterium]
MGQLGGRNELRATKGAGHDATREFQENVLQFLRAAGVTASPTPAAEK